MVSAGNAAAGGKAKKQPIYKSLYFQVIIAIMLGVAFGHFAPDTAAEFKPLGTGFINLVKMIIAPVIFLTVVHGIGSMNDPKKLYSVGGKALLYFLLISTLALGVGLVAAKVLQPGVGMNINPATLDANAVAEYAAKAEQGRGFAEYLLHIIPHTFVSAFTEGEVIQVLFVAVLFGLALVGIGEKAKPITKGIDYLTPVVFKIVSMLMKFAPVGAFGAIAFTVGEYGIESIGSLAKLIGTFYLTSLAFIFTVLWGVCLYHKINMFKLFAYLKEEILLVLGTSSSEPALPSLMKKLEHAGCSETSVGLIVPMGYSFNLCGINIYMTLGALFIAQALNIDLTFAQELGILAIAVISSKGAAGVAGAGFIILASTLSSVGTIPVAGMALILGIDRFMSECRAITSFLGNAVVAVAVARSAKEVDMVRFNRVISGEIPYENDDNHVAAPSYDERKTPDGKFNAEVQEARDFGKPLTERVKTPEAAL